VKVLANGTITIRTHATPTHYYTMETSDARASALAHLRPDLDAGEIRARLRARAQALAPVDRDWDPDIARLLEYTLLLVPLNERRARERAYNAFRPKVDEWRSVAAVAPAEIDIAEATRTYSRYAEKLRIGTGRCRYDNVLAAALPVPERRLHASYLSAGTFLRRLKLKADHMPAVHTAIIAHLEKRCKNPEVVILSRPWGGRFCATACARPVRLLFGRAET